MKCKLNKETALNITGVIFLLLTLNNLLLLFFVVKDVRYSLWFSDHVAFIMGLAILLRKRIIVTAELCIALVPETVWTLDFISKILFNKYLLGTTSYFLENGFVVNWHTISTMQHLLILPLGLTALWIMGYSKNGWKVSMVHGLVLWILSFFIGSAYNLNCIFRPCIFGIENIKNYMIIWPIAGFCFVMASNFLLKKIIKFKNK